MKALISLLVICLLLAVVALGQSNQAKGTRSGKDDAAPAKAGQDISGMYTFLQEGEFVQITLEDRGKVTGFISRYGDLESDRGAFLDQFFKTGRLDGNRLAFTTGPLHGVWFEFSGTVGRGEGKTPNEEAYYVVKGTLTQHVTDATQKTSARAREVTFKSFPQDAVTDKPKRD